MTLYILIGWSNVVLYILPLLFSSWLLYLHVSFFRYLFFFFLFSFCLTFGNSPGIPSWISSSCEKRKKWLMDVEMETGYPVIQIKGSVWNSWKVTKYDKRHLTVDESTTDKTLSIAVHNVLNNLDHSARHFICGLTDGLQYFYLPHSPPPVLWLHDL